MRARATRVIALGVLTAIGLAPRAAAQQVGARQFTVADNLADNYIEAIHQDSRGYVWFATRDGLSRFDGSTFKTYRTEDGLPTNRLYDVVEDAQRFLWIATARGLVRLVDDYYNAPARFPLVTGTVGAGARPRALIPQPSGDVWGLAELGIMRGKADASGNLLMSRISPASPRGSDPRIFCDGAGRVWAMVDRELVVFSADGHEIARYGAKDKIGAHWIVSVAQDRAGRIYAANIRQLFVLSGDVPDASARWDEVPIDIPAEMRWIGFDASDRLWIGSTSGVFWRRDGVVTEVSLSSGRGWMEVGLVDRAGNVWLGTHGQGVFRVPAEPILSFTDRQGVSEAATARTVESEDGRIYVATIAGPLVELRGGRAEYVPGTSYAESKRYAGGMVQTDGAGSWWIGTNAGELMWQPRGRPDYRRARVVWSAPSYPRHPYWHAPQLTSLRDGTVIVGGPDRDAFRAWTEDGKPRVERLQVPPELLAVTWATLDRDGNIWLGGLGRLARWSNGTARIVPPPPDIPEDARAHSPYSDSRGWLWVAFREEGVSVCRDPRAEKPQFETYRMAQGLSSNAIRQITEDRLGRMYFGSTRGVDRFDPATGAIRRIGLPEGLSGAVVSRLMTDRRGRVWVCTSGGVSLIDVEAAAPTQPVPPVLLTRVRIAGDDHPVPERGATTLAPLTLAPDKNTLVIDYVAVSHASNMPLRYRYRLGGQDRDWSGPTESRSVVYGGLGAGTYRFEVRAVSIDGREQGEPAALSFTVVAPVWRRPWFLATAALVVAAAGTWVHRLRLAQAIALERLRRQVAFDLHDDVGSGLSEIAILSELAGEESGRPAWATEIAGRARSLRESMGDIVWAVDPRHDSLGELVQRMRQIAFNLLEAQGMRVGFAAPDTAALERMDMAPDRRRTVLLIFKETIHNIAKHARARRVEIGFALETRRVVLTVEDDGCGFDVASVRGGHGLASLQRRADMLGGTLHVRSTPGGGTRIELRAPLG